MLLNMAHPMISAIRMTLTFWGDAIEYASYMLNHDP